MSHLRLKNLEIHWDNSPLIQNLNFEFKSGLKYSLQGLHLEQRNHFFKSISGLIEPISGEVLFQGNKLEYILDSTFFFQRKKISFLFSGLQPLANLSLMENLEIPLKFQGTLDFSKIKELAEFKLKLIGLSDKSELRPEKLSNEEKILLVTAMNIKENTEVLVIDEIFHYLELGSLKILNNLFTNTIDLEKCTILCPSHHKELFSNFEFLNYKIEEWSLKKIFQEDR